MKKIKIYILLFILTSVFSLTIISCNEDKIVNDYVIPDYTSGTWSFKQIGALNATNTIIYQDVVNTGNCGIDNIVIKADKTFDFNDFTFESGICSDNSYSGTYTIENNTITTKYVNDFNQTLEIVYTIVSLNNTEMVLSTFSQTSSSIVFYKLKKG